MLGRNPTTVFALSEMVGWRTESNKGFFINKFITNKVHLFMNTEPLLHVSAIAKTRNSGFYSWTSAICW